MVVLTNIYKKVGKGVGFQRLRRYISLCMHSPGSFNTAECTRAYNECVPAFSSRAKKKVMFYVQNSCILQMRTHIDIASIDVVAVISVVLGVQPHTGAL